MGLALYYISSMCNLALVALTEAEGKSSCSRAAEVGWVLHVAEAGWEPGVGHWWGLMPALPRARQCLVLGPAAGIPITKMAS